MGKKSSLRLADGARRIATSLTVALGVFALAALLGDSFHFPLDPTLFLSVHTAAELFAILVSFAVFAVAAYAPREAHPRIRLLSAALLAGGLLGVMNILSYALAPSFLLAPSPNRAVLFWLAARGVVAAALLAVAAAPANRLARLPRLVLYPAAVGLAAGVGWAVFRAEGWLPLMVDASEEPTAAKLWSELVVIALMLAAAARFWQECRTRPVPAAYYVQAIIWLTLGEVFFTLHQPLLDTYNLLGHIYKASGYFFILQAAYITNVRRPYEELEQALRELQEVDRLKDDFMAGLTHDLKTPLVPVAGFLDLVLSGRAGPITGKQAEFLGHCRRAVERQAELIEEMLDYARLRAGRMSLAVEVLDLREVLRDALKVLEPMARQRGLRVEAALGEEPVPVAADRAKFLRVVGNLFSNAVKFNREGGLVRVELSRRGQQAAVSIQDTGCGIAASERERVFERFYQAGGGRHGGSGIGLWVVGEIVRLHGGRVELESEPGQGSRFTFLLDRFEGQATIGSTTTGQAQGL